MDSQALVTSSDLFNVLDQYNVGDTVQLKVVRAGDGGASQQYVITLPAVLEEDKQGVAVASR